MKTATLVCIGLSLALGAVAADPPAKKATPLPPGTRTYQVALFKRGPSWVSGPAEASEIREERVEYLARLEREGKIALMGTFTDRRLYHSMIVFKVDSVPEAKALVGEMPSIKAERLVYEIHPWLSLDGIRAVPPRPGGPAPKAKAAPPKTQDKGGGSKKN